MKKLLLFLPIFLTAATCGIHRDTSALSAIDSGDQTIIFAGFGKRATDGLIHVRISDGAKPTGILKVIMPDLNCDRTTCATVDLVRKDGTIVPLGGIPKGQTELAFPLSSVTGDSTTVVKAHSGPYRVLIEAYFKDDDEEWKILGSGIIYVTVLERGYSSLGCNSSDMAWEIKIKDNCVVQYSSKFRTAVCGGGC